MGRRMLEALSPTELIALKHDWTFWARPDQLRPPGAWRVWVAMAGRGWGKTRVGAEDIRAEVDAGTARNIALVGATNADVRDVMVLGTEDSPGLMGVFPPHQRPLFIPSRRLLRFHNGAIARTFSAEKPSRLRGPQFDRAWADELAAWQRMRETWNNLMFGLRKGDNPRATVTTTPRPLPLLKELLADPRTAVTRGRTKDNLANLAPSFVEDIMRRYDGTTLGRQELDGELLDDLAGALWRMSTLDAHRVTKAPSDLARVIIGVDPSVAGKDKDDEGRKRDDCGIVAVGRTGSIKNYPQRYVLADYSLNAPPQQWAREVVRAYWIHQADMVAAEANNGGELVRMAIHQVDPRVNVKLVNAQRGKYIRAEPVGSAYERGEVHHVGVLRALEEEMVTWQPGMEPPMPSPNRIDALVWAITMDMEAASSTVYT